MQSKDSRTVAVCPAVLPDNFIPEEAWLTSAREQLFETAELWRSLGRRFADPYPERVERWTHCRRCGAAITALRFRPGGRVMIFDAVEVYPDGPMAANLRSLHSCGAQ